MSQHVNMYLMHISGAYMHTPYHFTKCRVTSLIIFLTWGNSSQNLETMVEGIQIKSEANETLRFASVCVCLYFCVCLK